MVRELPTETEAGAIGWAQDQLYQLKAQVGQLAQQLEQLQLATTKLGEGSNKFETSLQDAVRAVSEMPRLREELNQAIVLIVQLQDRQAETHERLDELGRSQGREDDRDLEEWGEVVKRTEQLERQVELWKDRQLGVSESTRRQTEELSRLRQQIQQMDARVEAAGGKASQGLEGASSTQQKLAELDSAIEDLRRQDDAIAERARVAADGVMRIEGMLEKNLEELRRMELLAERIELHRAERQRLEDRALKLEEDLEELTGRADTGDHERGRLNSQVQGQASRIDSLQEQVEEQRAILVERIRKLTATQDRTKRRQIQELERELREMKQFVADLAREEV